MKLLLVVLVLLSLGASSYAFNLKEQSALDVVVEQLRPSAAFFPVLNERFALVANGTTTNDALVTGWEGWLVLSIVVLLFFLFGSVFCFMGYKLFKLIIAIVGFIGGFLLGAMLTITVAGWVSSIGDITYDSTDDSIVSWVSLGVGILFGIILAFMSWWFYMVGIFIVGTTIQPTNQPSNQPTNQPTIQPSKHPSKRALVNRVGCCSAEN